jgi:hypothetical protein
MGFAIPLQPRMQRRASVFIGSRRSLAIPCSITLDAGSRIRQNIYRPPFKRRPSEPLPVPPVVQSDRLDDEGVPATLTPDAIRTLYSVWNSKNKIAALLTGTKSKRLAIINAALEQIEEVER